MLKLRRVTKVKVFFLVLVYVSILANLNLFEFSAAILEKGQGGYYIPLINRDWGHYREISDRIEALMYCPSDSEVHTSRPRSEISL